MFLTFQEMYTKCQTKTGDTSDASLTQFKEDINFGGARLNAAMNRYFTRKSKVASLVASQQYYQAPPDVIRVSGVFAAESASSNRRPLTKVTDEDQWIAMNYYSQTRNYLTHYFIRGADEIGLYPIPSGAVTDGLLIAYEGRDPILTQDDFFSGTITLNQDSTTVTHSGTGFTNKLVGRYFKTTDGSGDLGYRVAGYTSTSIITLEEPYIGTSGSGITFKIGQSFHFPGEYHDAAVDYALASWFEMNNNEKRAAYHLAKFERVENDAREKYASSTASQVVAQSHDFVNPWLLPPNAPTG